MVEGALAPWQLLLPAGAPAGPGPWEAGYHKVQGGAPTVRDMVGPMLPIPFSTGDIVVHTFHIRPLDFLARLH
jgi:hypothetical protein